MRWWPALVLLLVATACGEAANDIVASDASPSDAAPSKAASAETSGPVNDEQLLVLAGTTTEDAPTTSSTTDTSTSTTTDTSTSTTTSTTTRVLEATSGSALLGSEVFDLEGCPNTPRGAVTDKASQRYWLCMDGQAVTPEIPMTTASEHYGLPPVGTYPVFARDEDATGINGEPLERFVAFYTTPRGNRIAFHEVVDQDPATVGDLDQRGSSAGCFRVREADSIQVWEFLQIGDPVVVLTN